MVKDNMLPTLHSAQTVANILTASSQFGIIGQHLAKGIKTAEIADGLIFVPRAQSVNTDLQQIGFGTARKAKRSQGSASHCIEFECFADTRKHVALGDATGVTFINRGSQSRKFRLVFLLFALQSPQCRAHYFAGIFVATALNLASVRNGQVRR
jgi:hypothetical protein